MTQQRTALFVNKAAGGMFAVEDMALTTGNRFFVDSGSSTNGSTSGFGTSPDKPFSSVEAAVNSGSLTANNGDIVFVMPGHQETIDAAAALDLDVAGIRIQGLGWGSIRPTFDFTADAADIDIDAANIWIDNCIFTASSDDVAAAIDVNADWFRITNCLFLEDTTDKAFTVCILSATSNTSDFLHVEGCTFICPDAAASSCVKIVGGQGGVVRNNRFFGDWSAGAIDTDNTPTYVEQAYNLIYNADDTADNLINNSSTTTGIMAYNGGANADTQANQFTGTAMAIVENYGGVVSEDTSALLDPIET